MDGNFRGRTVIITGGSEGVGAATARRFAAEGANLVLVARRRETLEAVAEELRGQARVLIVPMDVTDVDACRRLLETSRLEFGAVHVLVNNAGYHSRGLVEDVAVEELGRMIDVNLKAPVMLSRLAIPYLREAGGGAIINVASLAGRVPVPGSAAYSASKFGLRAFTFALGSELGGSGVKLAAVSPGPVDTGFIMSNIDAVSDLTFSQPLSTAAEVADEIVRLCVNRRRERSMPPLSGFMAALGYTFPVLLRAMQPLLRAKGAKVKKRLKREMLARSAAARQTDQQP